MPTNEQRRQAAKRKLERQLERRAERAKRRRNLTVALSAVGAVVVLGLIATLILVTRGGSSTDTAAADATDTPTTDVPTSAAAPTSAAPAAALPTARATALPATVSCSYPATKGQPASKANTAPTATGVSAKGTVAVTMTTSAGVVPLTLDRAESPCTVNSFLSLAKQSYFNDTPCHRLTTAGIKVLQCGDPTGKGTGGPGYSFDNEFPTDTYAEGDAALQTAATYPRGTVAMANAGAGTNGSQFFLVYADSPLPPQYTVFGTISDAGLSVLEAVAAKGSDNANGQGDGAPITKVTITSMTAAA